MSKCVEVAAIIEMAWFELLQILHGDVGNVVESGEVTSNLCRRWLRAFDDHLISASTGRFEVEPWELPTVERLHLAASLQLRDCDIDVCEMAALLNAHRELMAHAAISRVGTKRWWRGVIGVTAVLHAALVC